MPAARQQAVGADRTEERLEQLPHAGDVLWRHVQPPTVAAVPIPEAVSAEDADRKAAKLHERPQRRLSARKGLRDRERERKDHADREDAKIHRHREHEAVVIAHKDARYRHRCGQERVQGEDVVDEDGKRRQQIQNVRPNGVRLETEKVFGPRLSRAARDAAERTDGCEPAEPMARHPPQSGLRGRHAARRRLMCCA